jgi:hypothetical protein
MQERSVPEQAVGLTGGSDVSFLETATFELGMTGWAMTSLGSPTLLRGCRSGDSPTLNFSGAEKHACLHVQRALHLNDFNQNWNMGTEF